MFVVNEGYLIACFDSDINETVITTIATSFGALLGGAIITESVYSMPGLGSYIVLGIKTKDTPSVMGSIITLAVFFTIIMLVVDLVYAFIDPRIKASYTKKK